MNSQHGGANPREPRSQSPEDAKKFPDFAKRIKGAFWNVAELLSQQLNELLWMGERDGFQSRTRKHATKVSIKWIVRLPELSYGRESMSFVTKTALIVGGYVAAFAFAAGVLAI